MEQKEKAKIPSTEDTAEKEAVEQIDPAVQSDPDKLGEGVPTTAHNVETRGRWWLPYVITFGVLAVITLLVSWLRGGYTSSETKLLLGAWSDAFFVPGILSVCFGLLVLASNGGAFDMLAYGFRRIIGLFKRDPLDRKYRTFYEYQQHRREKKRSFWYLVIVGAVYVVVSVALLVAQKVIK